MDTYVILGACGKDVWLVRDEYHAGVLCFDTLEQAEAKLAKIRVYAYPENIYKIEYINQLDIDTDIDTK